MTNRNQIWKRANLSSSSKCIEMLQLIFPSLSYNVITNESEISREIVDTKEEALKRIRLGLNKITEIEAGYYIEILNKKKKTSIIKF